MILNIENHPVVSHVEHTPETMMAFEDSIVQQWESGKIRGPVHLSHGNELQLIEVFKRIRPTDWVFSTWRSHYHALLKGIDPAWITSEILQMYLIMLKI